MGPGALVDPRQADGEGGAAPGLAHGGDVTAALVHDPVHRGETEAHALLARREERLEDAPERLGVHAHAGVDRTELDERAFRELDVVDRDLEPPAVRHRVVRVHREVHDHLLELAGIRADRGRRRCGQQLELDVLAEQPLQQRSDRGEDLVQIDRTGLQHLAPAEREQLVGELSRALGRTADLAEVVGERRIAVRALQQQRGVAADRGQQVVEVVRDAAGEAADALELLRVQQLVLQPFPVGDVARESDVEAG